MSAAAGAQVASSRHAILLILTAIMPTMGIVALVPVLPLLLREFASAPGSEVLVPVALTIPALCIAVFSPVAGALSDRLGRKPVLLVSMLVYGVVGALPLLLNDLIAIIAARAVLGLAEAAIMTVSTAMLGDYFDDARRERWISAQMASVSLSAILLVAIGGALGEALGSRGPFLLYLVALPIAIAVAAILFEPVHRAARAEPKARLPLGTLLPVLLITLGVGVLFYTIIVQVGPIVARSGVTSPALIGIAAAGTNLGVAIGSILFGRLKAHAGLQLLALGLALVALGYAGTALAPGFPAITGFAILACIGSGLMLPNMLAWLMRRLPAAARGSGTGAWTGAFFLGQFAAPLIATLLTPATGGLSQTLLLYTGLALAGAIAALIASSRPSALTTA
ncbi:MFS transporter [Sphingomonas sp. R1]|uniref:MFS transporter n=1 Tax=Sphingomonas sp. R1 TaxID=399176 RepID=UPI002224E9CA|nr:MFS transporter [Sphingomonas sp. R1]UYY79506.1 MFS transporter [Sphingomonas sp. R1]